MSEHRILIGDCRQHLATIKDNSIHCVVTSPPYWGLRDYGTAKWEGGDGACKHLAPAAHGYKPFDTSTLGPKRDVISPGNSAHADGTKRQQYRSKCKTCGAIRIDDQIGLEPRFVDYTSQVTEVFREVRRVLREDGTLWLNLGDSYATGTSSGRKPTQAGKHGYWENPAIAFRINGAGDGLKPKDLCGIPWRVALALQADGWYLRQDIIWAKPNPMPESVRDRCTKSHEYLFLLTKSERYYFDAEAIKEPAVTAGKTVKMADGWDTGAGGHGTIHRGGREKGKNNGAVQAETRNRRSVWTITTQGFKEAHFATFPPALVEPCIAAGTSERGYCSCGAPWVRQVDRTPMVIDRTPMVIDRSERTHELGRTRSSGTMVEPATTITTGWMPSCQCVPTKEPTAGIVLDPFGGAGTVALVAKRLNRHVVLIELNPEYAAMAEQRIQTG